MIILLQAVDELAEWDGQSPPTPKHQKGKLITPKIKDVIGKVTRYLLLLNSAHLCRVCQSSVHI